MKRRLFKYLNKKLKVGLEYIFKGGFWLVVNNLVSATSAILLAVILGNVLDPSVYGSYKYLVSVLSLVGALAFVGFKNVIAQMIARDHSEYFVTGTKVHFKLSLIMTAVALAGGLYYLFVGNSTLGLGLLLIAFLAPVYFTANLYSTYSSGIGNFKLLAKQNLIYTIFPLSATIVSAVFSNSPLIIFASFLIVSTIANVGIYFYILSKVKKKDIDHSDQTKYAIQLSLIGMPKKIVSALDNIIVFQVLGAVHLAIYSFAFAIPKQLRTSQRLLGVLSLPRFTNRNLVQLRKTMLKKLVIAYGAIIFIIIIYWISAPFIFAAIFPQYVEAVKYSQFISLMLLTVPTAMPRQALISHVQKSRIYTLEIVESIIRLISLVTLVPLYGLWGVVAALLVVSLYQITALLIAFFTLKSGT